MCGICGIVRADGARADRDVLARMSAALVHRGPDSGGDCSSTRRRGSRRGGWRSSTSRAATSRSPARTAASPSSRTARSTTTSRCAPSSSAPGTASPPAATPRCSSTSTRSTASASPSACAGCSPSRSGTAARGGSCSRATASGSSRSTTAWRPRGSPSPPSSRRCSTCPGLSRDVDLDALQAYLAFNAIHGPATIFREVRKLPPGHVLVYEGGTARIERYADSMPVAEAQQRDEPWEALAAELRERLRDSVRAHLVADVPVGVLLSGGIDSSALTALAAEESAGRVATFSIGFAERSFSELEQARDDRQALRHRPPRAGPAPRRRGAAAADRARLRRAVRGLLGAADLPGQLAGERARQGRALGRGRRRAVRRLRDLRRRRAGDAGARAARLVAPLVERLPSGSGRVPLDYRLKRFARAAHLPAARAPPRLEGDLLAGRARRAAATGPARHGGPARRLPRALGRDRGRRHARAAAGRRSRDLPRRRPAGEDRPHEHGPLARAARALPRPGGGRARARAAGRQPGSAASPRSGCCARRSSRSSGARSRAGARRASRSPRRPGCAASSSRSAREVLAAERLRSQGYFDPAVVGRVLDEHVARREDHSRQLWGLMSFSLWCDGAA